ncbi:MAG: DUF1156 domain-containing protein [Candidatus Hydrogenedentes bacterium]|nr:DUF1156 domain-containing protein [Candidatus Hydrogenedentota bacterium]
MHEKNVRHGHISTLHIWPARRPLAACRAALIATLLPDPGNEEARQKLLERLAGTVVQTVQKDGSIKEETEGGILHWGRESGPDLDYFREEIRKAYGGRAPRVLDPFAGGGAIPLEAMRLGCEATAIDINPVAWFILKCTLEYPQKLAGQKLPLPDFAANDPEFMEAYFKGTGGKKATKSKVAAKLREYQMELLPPPDADLAWHVRAWGLWVLKEARKELAEFYPTYADYQPLVDGGVAFEARPPRLVPLDPDGNADIHTLNVDYGEDYLKHPQNPRWVAKPTVAYLWARTVKCKNCRAIVPLLKTRWLCKKDKKRVVLEMEPNADKSGVVFRVRDNVPQQGGNAAQKRALDKKLGGGTMSRSGAQCPCCPAMMTMEDIRVEGKSGRLGAMMTAVVVEGPTCKEYRLPIRDEIAKAEEAESCLEDVYKDIPFGLPTEPLPGKEALGFRVPLYGFDQWHKLFVHRQLLTLGVLIRLTRTCPKAMEKTGFPPLWQEAVTALLTCVFSRTADYMANLCIWENGAEEVKHVFMRWALPITWDHAEGNPLSPIERFYNGGINSAYRVLARFFQTDWSSTVAPHALNASAITGIEFDNDIVFTDPPYYDAIPYSDLMDFFYIWIRRAIYGLSPEFDKATREALGPKWNSSTGDGELIDDSSRHEKNAALSKQTYEDGMYRSFSSACEKMHPNGRLVVVFANKNPNAWEALVAGIIRAGFAVTGSWPIATEMPGGIRNLNRASLASSLWLVCKKRPAIARPGWDGPVLDAMRERITERLRYFWDAGIRGPDFVWAATGPALEAYSKHPVVRKADEPGAVMSVSEFLQHVRRMVVDFAVGRILSHGEEEVTVTGLDDVTIYYLLHRNDFGMGEAPSGACIMYALSCGLSDKALADQYGILQTKDSAPTKGGLIDGAATADEESAGEDDAPGDDGVSSGGKAKLVPWNRRIKKNMGLQAPNGKPVPLIDQTHRLMHLWKAGDVATVNEYLDERALRNNKLFQQLLQAIIELAERGSQERSLLESISNHVRARGERHEDRQMAMDSGGDTM